MSMPPQGGGPPQQPGSPPPYGVPPGNYPQHPGQQPPGQQPPGFPQGPWPQQPPPPPKGNNTKWLLIAIALLLVVGVSIGATLLFTRDGGNDPSNPPTSGVPSDIASANDTGPVAVITEEPTCGAYIPLNDSLVKLRMQGWGDQRGELGPGSAWTAAQRSLVTGVSTAMANAADQMVALAQQTPHRVMRELYEQYIAYARAYVVGVPDYQPTDNYLASVNVGLGDALTAICTSIENGAASRSIAVGKAQEPTQVAPVGDPANPARFLTEATSTCTTWTEREDRLDIDLGAWSQLDTSIPGSQWTPEQRAVQEAAVPTLRELGAQATSAGRSSGNPTMEDFGTLAGLYFDAYASVGNSFTPADSWLSSAAMRLFNSINDACRAVTG